MNRIWEGQPIVIFGIGGAAKEVKVLIDDINQRSNVPVFKLVGFISNNENDIGTKIEELEVVSSNNNFMSYSAQFPILAVTIAIADPKAKEKIENEIFNICNNLVYPNLIHPNVNVPKSNTNDLGVGTIICAGVNFTTNIKFGRFVLANRSCNIGHDVDIGDYCTINPSAIISGNVTLGKSVLVGAGSSILEKVSIGENSTIGLGAIIVKDVVDNLTMICKPAEKLIRKD